LGDNADLQLLTTASRQARAGRLFVVEDMPKALIKTRYADVSNLIESGALRAPFPETFILATLEGAADVRLLGVLQRGAIDAVDGLRFRVWSSSPYKFPNGATSWRGPPTEKEGADSAAAAIAILSVVVDPHSLTRVEADAALNRARRVRRQPPIPAYWRVQLPQPTIIIVDSDRVEHAPGTGTHARPCPNERHGHQRHLKSGKVVSVRACKVNAHLPPNPNGPRPYYRVQQPVIGAQHSRDRTWSERKPRPSGRG
jgi:hypothetical protein